MVQPTIELDLSNTLQIDSGNPFGAPAGDGFLAKSMGLGLDVGVSSKVQLGVLFAIPLVPVADFGSFVADVQIAAVPQKLNVRVDVGAERGIAGTPSVISDYFFAGIGLPFRLKLHRVIAIVSGSVSARGFAAPVVTQPRAGNYNPDSLTGVIASSDVFAMDVDKNTVAGSVFLPIGLLIQPISFFSFQVRSGYRYFFHRQVTPDREIFISRHFVPLNLAATFTILSRVDLGFEATILGLVSGSDSGLPPGFEYPLLSDARWRDIQRYDFYLAARF